MKALNPSTPILIREHPGEEARLIATYGYGVERRVVVDGMDESSVEKELEKLVLAGDYMKKWTEGWSISKFIVFYFTLII